MGLHSQWQGISRAAKRAANTLGVIRNDTISEYGEVRNPDLNKFDLYFEGKQYAHLRPWFSSSPAEYVAIRDRKPLVNYNLPKRIAKTVTAKLVGSSVFPRLIIEEDPDASFFLDMLINASDLKFRIKDAITKMCVSGSSLVRFLLVEGNLHIETFPSKHCYPEFDAAGDLEFVKIQYTYADPVEKDAQNNPIIKWYRLDLGTDSDVLYDNPEWHKDEKDPIFEELERKDHGLGFVQAEWLRTTENKHNVDGESLLDGILEFTDEYNYSLSQSLQAINYNQEPQMTVNGMDSQELDLLIKSSMKAWDLGREGKAQFLESNLGAVERAGENRVGLKQAVMDVCRVIMLDPEKIIGSAQSAKAMELLHGPLVELINDLRPQVENRIKSLCEKMMFAVLLSIELGEESTFTTPQGWKPKSSRITANWPPIFPLTMEDLMSKVRVAAAASTANLISRATLTAWLAKDFGVENVEEEVLKVDSQKVINPFGGF